MICDSLTRLTKLHAQDSHATSFAFCITTATLLYAGVSKGCWCVAMIVLKMNAGLLQRVDHTLALVRGVEIFTVKLCILWWEAKEGDAHDQVQLFVCFDSPIRAAVFSECIPACVQLLASDSLHSTVCYIIYPIHLCSARQHHLQISNCNATARPCCQLSRWLTLCQCMKLSLQDSIQCAWRKSQICWELTVLPEALKQFENTSLDTMSSFFWSSPEMFCSPARPVKLEMPALFTMDAICLHATAIDDSTTASSLSILPSCSSCQRMNWG